MDRRISTITGVRILTAALAVGFGLFGSLSARASVYWNDQYVHRHRSGYRVTSSHKRKSTSRRHHTRTASRRHQKYKKSLCPKNSLAGTMYNMPVEGKTPHFWSMVHLNGSGILRNGDRVSYTGRHSRAPKNCRTTVTSSSGDCLLAYFGIAADLSKYPVGTIIYVPQLNGKQIKLPDTGEVITHPGYFIVQDTGSAIVGANRFDFFIGSDVPKQSALSNAGVGDKDVCPDTFRVVPPDSQEYAMAKNEIYDMTDSIPDKTDGPALASTSAPVSHPEQLASLTGGTR